MEYDESKWIKRGKKCVTIASLCFAFLIFSLSYIFLSSFSLLSVQIRAFFIASLSDATSVFYSFNISIFFFNIFPRLVGSLPQLFRLFTRSFARILCACDTILWLLLTFWISIKFSDGGDDK